LTKTIATETTDWLRYVLADLENWVSYSDQWRT